MSIDTLLEKYKTTKLELSKEVKSEFSKLFENFFAKYPEVNHIKFTAFTPYFNDGDACVFSVNDLDLYLVTPEELEEDDEVYHYGETYYDLEDGEFKKDFNEVRKEVAKIPDEIFKDAFGEGLFIVNREGVTVEEYDHD